MISFLTASFVNHILLYDFLSCSTARAPMPPWQRKCAPISALATLTRAHSCPTTLSPKATPPPRHLNPQPSLITMRRKRLAAYCGMRWQDRNKLRRCPYSLSLRRPLAFKPIGVGGRSCDALLSDMRCSCLSPRLQAGLYGAYQKKRLLGQRVRNDVWLR